MRHSFLILIDAIVTVVLLLLLIGSVGAAAVIVASGGAWLSSFALLVVLFGLVIWLFTSIDDSVWEYRQARKHYRRMQDAHSWSYNHLRS